MEDLPTYKIRWSLRAKRLSVQACLIDGLVVTAPEGMNPARIPQLLLQKKSWLVSMHRRLLQRWSSPDHIPFDRLPEKVHLEAIHQTLLINYKQTSSNSVRVQDKGDGLILVSGNISRHDLCRPALHRWLRRQGQLHLEPWLESVSVEVGLPYKKALVKRQKTRLGSCSPGKVISLNCKLLFLEPQVVRYVFIHELCHTVQLNHSANFWNLVQKFEPDCKNLKRQLKKKWGDLPLWTI